MGAPTAKLETVVIFSPYKINAVISALVSSILLLISLLTDYWLTAVDVKQGLWRNCTLASSLPSLAYSIRSANDINNFFICVPINKVLWIQICGGLVVVAFLCGIIGIVLSGLGFSHKKRQERKMKYYSATIFVYVVGGVCLLVSLTIFPLMFLRESHFRGKDKWYFGWSYGVAWGATIFLFGAALLMMCDRNREEIFYRERLYLNQDDDDNVEANQEAKIKTLR